MASEFRKTNSGYRKDEQPPQETCQRKARKEVFGWFALKRIREYVSASAPHIQAHAEPPRAATNLKIDAEKPTTIDI